MTESSKYNITVKEAMDILDVSRITIYRRLRSGELEGKKVVTDDTRKWLISENSIYDNTVINETVKLEEVDKNINKDQLMNELVSAINNQEKELLDEAMQEIKQQLHGQKKQFYHQKKLLKKQNEKIQAQEKQLQEQNEYLKEQNRLLRQQIQAEKSKSEKKSLLQKIKSLFN